MDTVVLPVIVLTVAPEEFKNTYLAVLGISGLLMAAMVQPTIGRISDRTQSPLGPGSHLSCGDPCSPRWA